MPKKVRWEKTKTLINKTLKNMERIGFGRRLGAAIIDGLILTGLAYIIIFAIPNILENLVDWSKISEDSIEQMEAIYGNFANTMMLMAPAIAIASFLYNLLEGFKGYTLGKLMLGIQIGNQDGTQASVNKLMLRFSIKNISTILNLIAITTFIGFIDSIASFLGLVIFIGCFFVLGEKKLAFHDMIAKTAVYKKSDIENN